MLSLMEEGKLALNDPVSRFIPAFAKTTVAVAKDGAVTIVPAKRAITIRGSADAHGRHLVRHRARRWRRSTRPRASGRRLASVGTPRTRTSRSATRWSGLHRSHLSPSLARRMSTATTRTFSGASSNGRQACRSIGSSRTRITGPLRMQDTHFYLPPDQRDRLAAVYASGPDGQDRAGSRRRPGAGALRRRPAQEFRRRRRIAVHGAGTTADSWK